MPIFLTIHKLPSGMTENEARTNYDTYKKSAIEAGLKPLGAVVSFEKGFSHCQTEADTAEQVRKAHSKVNAPIVEIIKVLSLP